jgi:hypothetical protein
VGELKLAQGILWIVSSIEGLLGHVRLRCEDWCCSAESRQEARRG